MAGGRPSTGLVSAAVRLQVLICEVVMTSLRSQATLLRKKGRFAQGAIWPGNGSHLINSQGLDAIFRSSRPLRGDYEFATDRDVSATAFEGSGDHATTGSDLRVVSKYAQKRNERSLICRYSIRMVRQGILATAEGSSIKAEG